MKKNFKQLWIDFLNSGDGFIKCYAMTEAHVGWLYQYKGIQVRNPDCNKENSFKRSLMVFQNQFGLLGDSENDIICEPLFNGKTLKEFYKIVVVNDYDDYFTKWADKLVHELILSNNTKIKTIIINSGPYKNCGMSFRKIEDELYLDFYSAIRVGMGSIGITPKEFAKHLMK